MKKRWHLQYDMKSLQKQNSPDETELAEWQS